MEPAPIIGQERPKRILEVFLNNQRIPHAMLFTGRHGVGKRKMALSFAMACNCQQRNNNSPQFLGARSVQTFPGTLPCGKCPPCKKIHENQHPDVLHLRPQGLYIKVDQIRELNNKLGMRPYESRFRFVIIDKANQFNPTAGNALLKILEEPPADTYIILISGPSEDLLQTIVSRCQLIRFQPVLTDEMVDFLVGYKKIDPDYALVVAQISDGNQAIAESLLDGRWFAYRKWILQRVLPLSSKPVSEILLLSEILSRDKKVLDQTLSLMYSWFRDILICKYDESKIINRDHQKLISKRAGIVSSETVLTVLSAVQTTQQSLRTNVQMRIMVESLLFQLAKDGV